MTIDGRTDIIVHLKQFLRKNILIYKHQFLHYLRQETRFLDIAHNSAHEGTNHGMKANAVAILPGHNPVTSAERMVIQAFLTVKKLEEETSRTLQQTKQWSVLPTAAHLVQVAESILQKQVDRFWRYVVRRIGYASFEVSFVPDPESHHNEMALDDLVQLPVYNVNDKDEGPRGHVIDEELTVPTGTQVGSPIPLFRRT